eukprot:TRINITY_DN31133_c0_g1_i1.p1 TRINITY_DN31133_c0_g1~~TRINITY_DN31133_c0_g1_i1.p1  ORF type:complete len:187 (+),score=48.42 TRINITY_DN31133_c0_g1_i1:37-597(+)
MSFRRLEGEDKAGAEDVVLTTSDNVKFAISKKSINLSKVLKEIIDDVASGEEANVPLANVDAATLECVAPFLTHYTDAAPEPIEKPLKAPLPELLPEWDKGYVYGQLIKNGDEKQHEMLFKTLMAGNFLGIEPLRDLCCAAIANILRGKTPEQIMEVFGVTEPFTPEEEKAVEEQYPWLKEGSVAP